jgi:hypothetical protein
LNAQTFFEGANFSVGAKNGLKKLAFGHFSSEDNGEGEDDMSLPSCPFEAQPVSMCPSETEEAATDHEDDLDDLDEADDQVPILPKVTNICNLNILHFLLLINICSLVGKCFALILRQFF